MSDLINLEPWWRFAVALLIGALIGLEREFVQQKMGEEDFAGIRTFSLMSLLGAIGAYLVEDFGILPFLAAYIGIILLVWASYMGEIVRKHEEGITTEVAAIIAPLLGAMVIWGEFEIASEYQGGSIQIAEKTLLRNLSTTDGLTTNNIEGMAFGPWDGLSRPLLMVADNGDGISQNNLYAYRVTFDAPFGVPLPGTLSVSLAGLLGLAWSRRRRV